MIGSEIQCKITVKHRYHPATDVSQLHGVNSEHWSFMAQRYKLLQALATQTVLGLTRNRMRADEAACKYDIISA